MEIKNEKLKKIYHRFETFIKYTLVGVVTAFLNYSIYFVLTAVSNPHKTFFALQWWEIVNIISWLVAVIYSFFANRKFVFASKNDTKKRILYQVVTFFGLRFISMLISMRIMDLFINKAMLDHRIAKIIGIAIEIAINYFCCKLLIFPQRDGKK